MEIEIRGIVVCTNQWLPRGKPVFPPEWMGRMVIVHPDDLDQIHAEIERRNGALFDTKESRKICFCHCQGHGPADCDCGYCLDGRIPCMSECCENKHKGEEK